VRTGGRWREIPGEHVGQSFVGRSRARRPRPTWPAWSCLPILANDSEQRLFGSTMILYRAKWNPFKRQNRPVVSPYDMHKGRKGLSSLAVTDGEPRSGRDVPRADPRCGGDTCWGCSSRLRIPTRCRACSRTQMTGSAFSATGGRVAGRWRPAHWRWDESCFATCSHGFARIRKRRRPRGADCAW
jgi:hypothetical protein